MHARYLLGPILCLAVGCGSDDSSKNGEGTPDASADAGGGTGGSHAGSGGSSSGTGGASGGSGGASSGTGGASSSGGDTGTGATPGSGGAGGGSDAGSPDGGQSDAGTDGSLDASGTAPLTITITGTTTGKVRITGNNVDQNVTSSTVVDLPVGTYTVTPETVRVDGTYVDTLLDPDSGAKNVHVGGGGASVTVSYATRPGTGHLWVVSAARNEVAAYSDAQLALAASAGDAGAGAIAPDIVIQNPNAVLNLDYPYALAFDRAGNLWVGSCGQLAIVRYAVSDLRTSGAPTPDRVVQVPGCTTGLAFGPTGVLGLSTTLQPLAIAPSDLAQSGTASPLVLGASGFLQYGDGATFDADGNLWMVDYITNHVYRWDAASLLTGATDAGAPAPGVTLSGSALGHPAFINWNTDGSPVVTAFDADELAFFTRPQTEVSGSPVPQKRLGLNGTPGVTGPEAPAFDEQGNLWVPDYWLGKVVGFSAAALAQSPGDAGVATIDGFAVLGDMTVLGQPYMVQLNPSPTWASVYTP